MAPPAQGTRHIGELDGLRGVACLLVLLWHLVHAPVEGATGWLAGVRLLLSQTWSGVDLFFVLSGFLITRSLEGRKSHRHRASDFLWSRAARLVPAYAALVAAYPILRGLCLSGRSPASLQLLFADRMPSWVYACFGQGWYVVFGSHGLASPFGSRYFAITWSLSAEVMFYLGTLVLFSLVPRERRFVVFAWFGLLAVLIRAGVAVYGDPVQLASYVLPPARMDAFALGALAAYLLESEGARAAASSVIAPFWILLLAGVALLVANGAPFSGRFPGTFSYSWFALFYTASLTWVLLNAGSPATRFLARGPLVWLGIISYSVFLWHFPLHYLYTGALGLSANYVSLPGEAPYLLGEIASVLAIGALSYHLIEKPAISWNRRREKRREALP